MSAVESPYMTVQEAAAYLKLSIHTVRNRSGEIRRVPGTARLLFRREWLDEWLARPRPTARRRPTRS